ncbi:MAG: hypothetical protein CM15mP3_03810 [Candidatus Poseidoniales archaeon]|nr:MAG: hypothetical protein CM15mP3_03810 [Candidatus Poseidoniales archaeon]
MNLPTGVLIIFGKPFAYTYIGVTPPLHVCIGWFENRLRFWVLREISLVGFS